MSVRAETAYEDLVVPKFTKTRDLSVQVHAFLRHLIIDEVLKPGSTLNQANLARKLAVSRIPMREAFRMLQQEGLIDVQKDQRATIRSLSASELDNLYGTRIVLESLAVRVTAGRLTDAEVQQGRRLLEEMNEALTRADVDTWVEAHRLFHATCTARAEDPLSQLIQSLSERTERYVRFAQAAHPDAFSMAQAEHEAILDALISGEREKAGELMGEHLSHTASRVLPDLDENSEGTTFHEAQRMAARS
ncbi:GntR family transcriptional regulator [Paenarthrobacter ureafaciens]|uniref:GntR family transcriptional regulator n=1 Tax=Paenarthrobacter TaxID=1742992 RepID=UPI0015BA6337|nr:MULTISPECIES: GntR family transcriptional regulator [Paenarthrobacter]NWL10394.1 GntR family transcriptional regulator [Paenarthrobacter nitroguajacolicus]NWL26716.1 GntR family transcriptional regulator [Paenarthrobacter ureafaciens]NWL32015.1 GntR family transcriptional regulator [Paenarthrobacter nitroguajacolicus]